MSSWYFGATTISIATFNAKAKCHYDECCLYWVQFNIFFIPNYVQQSYQNVCNSAM